MMLIKVTFLPKIRHVLYNTRDYRSHRFYSPQKNSCSSVQTYKQRVKASKVPRPPEEENYGHLVVAGLVAFGEVEEAGPHMWIDRYLL